MVMHVTFDSLKTFYDILVQKLKNHRGNWNQNDPTADDYIKNRPFYSEGIKEITIIDTIVNFDNSSSGRISNDPIVYQIMIDDYSANSFKIGEAYTVIWDDQTYECVAQDIDGIGAIGNANLIGYMGSVGYEDTGEPFLIGAEQGYGYIVLGIEDGNHTMVVKTTMEIIKKLDKKFIDMPDDIVTDEELNNVVDNIDNQINDVVDNIDNQINNLSSVAFSGDYSDLNNKPTIYTDVVRYNSQITLSERQKQIARNNIDAAYIKHTHPYLQYLDTDTIMPAQGSWYSMAYGNGIFVAIQYGGGAAYSKDGIIWTEVATPVQGHILRSITYGNGKFVAVAEYAKSDIIIYSTDGIIWNTTTISTKANWSIIKYDNGKFVAVANQSDKLICSEDGINWTEVTLSSSGWWMDIAYGNGKFIITDMFLSQTAISEDGVTWNIHTTSCGSLNTNYAGPLTYYNGKFIALRSSGTPSYGFQSEDGITWTQVDMPKYSHWSAITYGNGKLVAVSTSESNSSYGIDAAYSEDGLNWYITTLPSKQQWKSVAYGNGKFVAISALSDAVAYSIDGVTWFNHYTGILQDGVSVDLATEEEVVKVIPQTLTEDQKAQARANIGAGTTPIKGVDYWTEEDKAEIREYIDQTIYAIIDQAIAASY